MNEQYFAVVYCKDGTWHGWPGESKEDCMSKLESMRDNPKVLERIKATTIIKRDMSNFKEGMIFGCPKSLNVIKGE